MLTSDEYNHEWEEYLDSHDGGWPENVWSSASLDTTDETSISSVVAEMEETEIQTENPQPADRDENRPRVRPDVEASVRDDHRRHGDVVVSYTHTYTEREKKKQEKYYCGDGGYSSRQDYN